MCKKMFFLLSIFTFLTLGVNAQPSSESVLASMQKSMDQFQCKKVAFNFTAFNSSKAKIGEEKGVILSQGEYYKMTTSGVEVYCDGATVRVLNIEDQEVVILPNDPSKNDIANNPFAILANVSKNNSFPSKPKVKQSGEKTSYSIELKPLNKKKSSYLSVEVSIDGSTFLPTSLKYISQNGDTYIADVTSFTGIDAKTASFFTLDVDKLGDVVVTDLR